MSPHSRQLPHARASWPLAAAAWSIGIGAVLTLVWSTRAHADTAAQDLAFMMDREAWPLVVPMVAAATSIERLLELGWNFIEWGLLHIGNWQPADLKQASYQQFKSGVSLLVANLLGIGITSYTDVHLLSYLQPDAMGLFDQVPVTWDILLTGLLIGSGTKPAHDILGTITRFKTLVGNIALKQRQNASLFAADAAGRLQEQQYAQQTRTMAAHQPTVRTAQAPVAPARDVQSDLDSHYEL